MKPTHFFAATDTVVVDVNPEMADYDNPRGEIMGYAAYVYAEDAAGNRVRTHVASSRWMEEFMPRAVQLAAALNARLAAGRLPVGFDRWEAARPAYGSEAYVQYGAADDLIWERQHDECSWR